VARVPKCPECVIVDLCEFKHKTRLVDPRKVDEMAVKPAKKTPAKRGPLRKRVVEPLRPARKRKGA
jgi:hypothetical protein